MKSKRLQRRRTPGHKNPQGAIFVGRPTVWGNPFVVKKLGDSLWGVFRDEEMIDTFSSKRDAAEKSVKLFEEYARANLIDTLAALAGRDLLCSCSSKTPCHADVLLKLIEEKNK